MKFLKGLGLFIALIPAFIIAICTVIMITSITLECVTGYDLIRETIRPFFQSLR